MRKRKFLDAEYEHLCILIFAQNTWKEKDFIKLEEKTVVNYLENTPQGDCDVCLTCDICRGTWELFDPENPGKYNPLCNYCEVLLPFFKKFQSGENVLLFSHQTIDSNGLRSFTETNLSNEKVKKIYILQLHEWREKRYEKYLKAEELIDSLSHVKITHSDFLSLLDEDKFEYRVLYEISKDSYY